MLLSMRDFIEKVELGAESFFIATLLREPLKYQILAPIFFFQTGQTDGRNKNTVGLPCIKNLVQNRLYVWDSNWQGDQQYTEDNNSW